MGYDSHGSWEESLGLLHALHDINNECLIFSGVKVVSFQADGGFSDETYMRNPKDFGFGDSLNAFTMCFRLKTFYLRGTISTFFAYATPRSADTFTGWIRRDAFDEPYR